MQFTRSSWLCLLAAALGGASSCTVAGPNGSGPSAAGQSVAQIEWQPDLPVARAPFEALQANWKQRLNQPYVFVELQGSYTRIGEALQQTGRAMRDQGLDSSGPPFALYYDDPGQVAAESLIARACFPVSASAQVEAPLRYDLLESTTVVYAFVAGAYPEVPQAYPAMFRYMKSMNWSESGPIREVYLVNPAEVSDFSQLVTEVQIPAGSQR